MTLFPSFSRTLLLISLLCLSNLPSYTSAPTPTSWTLDMSYGLLTLVFSEKSMSTTFDATKVTIQNRLSSSGGAGFQSLTFSGNSYTKVYNSTSLYIAIPIDDYAALSLNPSLAKSVATSYLVVGAGAVKAADSAKALSSAVVNGAALPVAAFTPDATAPSFLTWNMNMNDGTITLNFNEPMDYTYVVPGNLQFQSVVNLGKGALGNKMLTLTSNNFVNKNTQNGKTLVFDIGESNLNSIKGLTPLATSSSNLYLS